MVSLKQWIKNINKNKPCKALKLYQDLFQQTPLIIVDVGSTGGIDCRWHPIREYCSFYTFDPDPRDRPNIKDKAIHFPIGLWSSHQTNKTLFLAAFPCASGFYPTLPSLNVFVNSPCHQIVGQGFVPVNSLMNVLKDHPFPHFIKIDAEGADLEILRGAELFLQKSCLGIQVEVPFIPRHEAAPLYGDISKYLENFGFQLFDLFTERWVRSNQVHGVGTRAQIVWADAIFFLSASEFFQRTSRLSHKEQTSSVLHFIALLLSYNLYDYAVEIIETSQEKAILSKEQSADLIAQIKKSIPALWAYCLRSAMFIGLALIATILFYPIPNVGRRSLQILKNRWKELLTTLSFMLRNGPYRCAIN